MSFILKNTEDQSILHENEFQANDFITSRLVEQKKELALPFAKGLMQQWYFDGIRMSYVDWNYHGEGQMQTSGDLDMVTLYFNLRGNLSIKYKGGSDPFVLNSYQHNMLYTNGESINIQHQSMKLKVFMIQFTKDIFLRLTENSSDILKRFGEQVLNGQLTCLSTHSLPIDITLFNAIRAVINSKYETGLKKIFLLSKAIEILVLQAESFNTNPKRDNLYLRTGEEKEKIIYARNYLIENLMQPPSLSQLARKAGINEFKLKKGFKEVFNNTVFGYLADSRLEMAKEQLMEGTKTASEIAFSLGYSSVQHFGSAFKKKFGFSPMNMK